MIRRALEAGLHWMVLVGYDIPSSERVLTFNKRGFPVAVGIHPHDVGDVKEEDWDKLEELARHPSVSAIGETGLDFYRFLSPRDKQVEGFLRHLSLAQRLGLPVIVHSRGAVKETLQILKEFPDLRVVLHCFEGGKGELIEAIDRGYYIGVTGNITYPNSRVRELVDYLPIDRVLLETDSPYLPPQSCRGRTNEPAYLGEVAETVAFLKKVAVDYIKEVSSYNAEVLFRRRK